MTSVFASKIHEVWKDVYNVEITFRDKLIGGIPKNPKMIEAWLRKHSGVSTSEEEIRRMLITTMHELGAADVDESMSMDELIEQASSLVAEKQTTGFKSDEYGLYVEARQIMAMLKESVNAQFGGMAWGAQNKSRGKRPAGLTAEHLNVEPDRIYLGRQEPDGIEFRVKHLTGPTGPYSAFSYEEYVQQATITFQVEFTARSKDIQDHIVEIWVWAERKGFGSARSQGYGKFEVTKWEDIKQRAA